MTHTSTDFQTFPPAPKVVTVADTAIELTPIRLGELPRLLATVRPIAADLSAEPDWFDLLARHGEAVLELLTLATRRERAWVNDLSLEEAVTLAAAVFEVNADFFVRRVVPAIQGAAQRLAPMLSAGTTSSPA
ncbi:hypothetical protein Q5W_04885 [Hydrogenophaga sp. PBC]|uniref:DUF6631 family protein n=1 Tax=Hydrogenophaga sp. PBC TaxID=795665 RepID=UPI0002608BD9|nr:DUF6631 family protein [Hydrogenophaga sp. PBC]AOS78350.1 hypothetical protein Q5W_04885 [Hydrogenophaga sp. PBC]